MVADAKPRVLGYALIGAGGVSVGTGLVLGVMSLKARGEAKANCAEADGRTFCKDAAREDLARNNALAIGADVAIGVGLVAAAAGSVLVWRSKEKARARGFASWRVRGGVGRVELVGAF